jgi:mycothiol synthase
MCSRTDLKLIDSKSARPAPTRAWTSRPYQSEDDLRAMQRLLMEARARTDDWRYPHVGDLMWGFFITACHLDPHAQVRLWHDPADWLIGYALLGEDPSLDFQVLPDAAWSARPGLVAEWVGGIEAEALAWAEARLAELRRQDAARWGGGLIALARQDDLELIASLERCGFRYRGEHDEVNLLRDLDEPIPEPVLPAGWQVRAVAGPDEAAARAGAQREVWRPWSVGDVRDADYAALMRLPGYDRELDVVAVAPDGLVGAYVNGWIDPVNRIGDFGPVGTRPACRRLGLGRAALLEGLRRMRARGMTRVCVSTGVENTPAQRLYESVGFRVVNRTLEYATAE